MTVSLSLFEPRPDLPVLRPYQREAVDSVLRELGQENRSTLLVAATGTGKTQMFSEVVRRWRGRALVLAHREELIRQGARRLEQLTGRMIHVEQADEVAHAAGDATVMASVQTLSRERRLNRFAPDAFSLIVVDEAHHAPADTYRKILDRFSSAKILGVTATPDRADRLALGSIFDSVAFVYDIEDAIRDGWLCPIRCTIVQLESMDIAGVRTTAGDLNQGDLDAVMAVEKNLHGVAKPTFELSEGRRTLVFTTGVANAHRLAEIFNRYHEGCARAIDGTTPADERRRIFGDHQDGRFQYLVNVGIATEGYDDPAISCVVMGRPTKSRALYTQCVGRGTRIHPGKTDLLVLDFAGNVGRHRLVTAHDILAGKHPDEVVDRARRITARNPGTNVADALAAAEAQLAAEKAAEEKRRAVRMKVDYKTRDVDPFAILDVQRPTNFDGQFGKRPATEKQIAALQRFKVPIADNLGCKEASLLLDRLVQRARNSECTFKQAQILKRYGYTTDITMAEASYRLDMLARNNWKYIHPDNFSYEPGSDG